MSVSMDTNTLAQQIKDVTLNAVNTVKDAVVGEATPQDDTHRVFVGNLKVDTTEDELKSLFSQVGQVVSVTLPAKRANRTKGAEPTGIAFVGFTSDADVQKAVETLSGKTLGDREINVAVARPLADKKPRSKPAPKTTSASAEDSAVETATGDATGADGEKKKRTKKPKAKKVANGESQAETAGGDEAAAATDAPAKPRTPRAPREKGPPSDGVPSTTTLFVAGLDHKTTDAELKQMFSEYNALSAHVALRPIPRFMIKKLAEKGEQRLSRGFGFVTFADQSAQTAALKAMDGHSVGDRQLAVKVAVDSPEKSEQIAAAQAAQTAA